MDPDIDRTGQADADMVARVGVEDIDILALLTPLSDLFVGFADGGGR